MTTTADRISAVCDGIKQTLLDKNAAYGDSVSNPLRVFSRAEKMEAIKVRIDDKLSRISRGTPFPGDDDVTDLIGYLILFVVNDESQPGSPAAETPTFSAGAPLRMIDKDGDMWVQGVDGLYGCFLRKDLGRVTYSWLRERYAPLRYVNAREG